MDSKAATTDARRDSGVIAFLRRIYPIFKPWQLQSGLALMALAIVLVADAGITYSIQHGVDRLAAQNGDLRAPIFAVLGLTLVRLLLLNWGRRRNALVSTGISSQLRQRFYEHLQTLGRHFYTRNSLGDLMARTTRDVGSIQFFSAWQYNSC